MNQPFIVPEISDQTWCDIGDAFTGCKLSIEVSVARVGKDIADAISGLANKIEQARKKGDARVKIFEIEFKGKNGTYIPGIEQSDRTIQELKSLFWSKGYRVESQRFLQLGTGDLNYYSNALFLNLIPSIPHASTKAGINAGAVESCG